MSKFLEWLGTAKAWVASKLANVPQDGWLHRWRWIGGLFDVGG